MATTYNFTDGSVTGQETATQTNCIETPLEVRRNTIDFSQQTLEAGEADVAQCLIIPAYTTVVSAFIRVITAEGADGSVDLGYGTDPDYWGNCLHLDATGSASTVLTGSETWDAASMGDGNEEMEEVTVVGAAIGDTVIVNLGIDIIDLEISGQVTAEDTVTIVLSNNTGGTLDLGSTTLEVFVLKAPRAAAPVYFAAADTIDVVATTVNGDVDIDGAKIEVIALCINH